MKHLKLFEDFHEEDNNERVLLDLEEQLEKELEWVDKYRDFVDNGTFPEDDYNDSDEFYADLKKTEDNIEDLNKQLRELKKGVKEGIFNTGIFNRGVIDFTKPMTTSPSRSRWWKRRRQETPKKVSPRPYYGVQEEEEEEQPYSKQKYVKRTSARSTTRPSDDEYWSDENVKKRQERNKKK